METAADPGMTPRSARHRAPRRAEKLGLAGEPGIVISAPVSAAGARTDSHTREEADAGRAGDAEPTGRVDVALRS